MAERGLCDVDGKTRSSAAGSPNGARRALRPGMRALAMDADSLATARRIRQPIESNDDIENAFDFITYLKGGEVLEMFEAWVGEETFRKGVHEYLKSHAFGNATAADFVGSIASAAKKPACERGLLLVSGPAGRAAGDCRAGLHGNSRASSSRRSASCPPVRRARRRKHGRFPSARGPATPGSLPSARCSRRRRGPSRFREPAPSGSSRTPLPRATTACSTRGTCWEGFSPIPGSTSRPSNASAS